MGTKPRKYDDEFKRQAVYRLIHERISVTQLARELGTTTTALYEWKRRLSDEIAPPPTNNLSAEDELKKLRREAVQLREDNVILKKIRGVHSKRIAVKYAFVKEHQAIHSVRCMCTLLAIASAGYYEWTEREPSRRSIANDQLLQEIVAIHKESRNTYGSPRIRAALLEKGRQVNRKHISRIMRCAGIQGVMRRRFRCTTDSNHKKTVAPNLINRAFTVPTLNTHRCGDITYVATREGWLYLAVVLDLVSRSVVGWSMGTRINAGLVTDALASAMKRRRPKSLLMFHSDRGSQYVSETFLKLIDKNGILQSMNCKGNC